MRSRIALLLGLLFASVSLASPPAGAVPATFTFYGAGFGHGIGMSQWGSYGLAAKGWSHGRILAHYYRGTRVAQASSPPSALRIGLLQGKGVVHATAVGGPVQVRLLGSKRVIGSIPQGVTWTVSPGRAGGYQVKDATANLVGGKVWGASTSHLLLLRVGGSMVQLAETKHTYNRGSVVFDLSRSCATCAYRERVIVVLSPQSYLYGLGEVPSSWPAEALEAQAVAARTYAFEKVARLGQHRPACNCALYATTIDQNYVGWSKESGAFGGRWVAAVDATAGQVVTYRGALIQAYYHSSSGGVTASNEEAWGGTPLPYLRSVCDPGDFTSANPVRTWTRTFTAAALTKKLAPFTGAIGAVTRFTSVVRGASGRIDSVVVHGASGQATISGSALKSGLGLLSDRVWIGSNLLVTGAIRTAYDRLMCAPGAATGPRRWVTGGFRQSFARGGLYQNLGADVVSWLHGAIYDRYVALGQTNSRLGLPVTSVHRLTLPAGCRTFRCEFARFDHGAMYFKGAPGVGTHELHGSVYEFFVSLGGVRSALRFPTSDVRTDSKGRAYATFERGRITCRSNGSCWQSSS